jgi:hypothetical protein
MPPAELKKLVRALPTSLLAAIEIARNAEVEPQVEIGVGLLVGIGSAAGREGCAGPAKPGPPMRMIDVSVAHFSLHFRFRRRRADGTRFRQQELRLSRPREADDSGTQGR